ncbi:hypothetical protein [Polaromonas sp. SM01]|uniref:hypothetical protein n=1 Tax=Polaromonas sp. SM01 TaxID=3085630 RepID=UPI002980E92E|nr:hypothetical protein [Polaromonas sp. SM01]MDW5444636.1 hypothetical protein [Polaromonas sp. SM01]
MTHFIATRVAIVFIAACALSTWARAQNDTKKSTPTAASVACPSAAQLQPVQLYGAWRVQFSQPPAGLPADATMRLERHAEFSESLAGAVSRELGAAAGSRAVAGHAARAQLAGDLEDGFLTLDESSNGISITGTWNGEMVEGSCGKKFKGTWKDTSSSAPPDAADVPFTLERNPGW